jgi:hypothetical protein
MMASNGWNIPGQMKCLSSGASSTGFTPTRLRSRGVRPQRREDATETEFNASFLSGFAVNAEPGCSGSSKVCSGTPPSMIPKGKCDLSIYWRGGGLSARARGACPSMEVAALPRPPAHAAEVFLQNKEREKRGEVLRTIEANILHKIILLRKSGVMDW